MVGAEAASGDGRLVALLAGHALTSFLCIVSLSRYRFWAASLALFVPAVPGCDWHCGLAGARSLLGQRAHVGAELGRAHLLDLHWAPFLILTLDGEIVGQGAKGTNRCSPVAPAWPESEKSSRRYLLSRILERLA